MKGPKEFKHGDIHYYEALARWEKVRIGNIKLYKKLKQELSQIQKLKNRRIKL